MSSFIMSGVSALGVLGYVSCIAWVMTNGERVFGKVPNFWGPIAFLLLFVVSACITAAMVLGRPIFLFVNGARGEAVRLFAYTVGWLAIFALAILTGLLLR